MCLKICKKMQNFAQFCTIFSRNVIIVQEKAKVLIWPFCKRCLYLLGKSILHWDAYHKDWLYKLIFWLIKWWHPNNRFFAQVCLFVAVLTWAPPRTQILNNDDFLWETTFSEPWWKVSTTLSQMSQLHILGLLGFFTWGVVHSGANTLRSIP